MIALVAPAAGPAPVAVGVKGAAVLTADHKLRPLRHGKQQRTSRCVRAVVVPARGMVDAVTPPA